MNPVTNPDVQVWDYTMLALVVMLPIANVGRTKIKHLMVGQSNTTSRVVGEKKEI
jgi:hypothetical protein